MKRHFRIYLLLFCVFGAMNGFGQDPIFSQFYASPLQINPAFTGNTNGPNVNLNYRNQWLSFGGVQSFRTYAISYNQFFRDFNSGLGVEVMADDAGEGLLKTTSGAFNYSYKVQVNRNLNFKLGAKVGAFQLSLDWDRLEFHDQLQEINSIPIPSQETRPLDLNKVALDIGAGVLAYSKNLYAGFSLNHLNTPDVSFLGKLENLNTGLPMRLTFHAGGQFVFREGNNRKSTTFISPNIMVIRQGNFGQINGGAYFGLGSFFAGAWYRYAWTNPDAAIILLGFHKDFFKIGYSFDVPLVSNLGISSSGGTHEISVGISFANEKEDINDCFQLFR